MLQYVTGRGPVASLRQTGDQEGGDIYYIYIYICICIYIYSVPDQGWDREAGAQDTIGNPLCN